ncbi:hypothetical protein SAMN04487949_2306 [Halogranum gelatinilyticum]|uniref:SpoVT-AbrB domain-containing protein n=1 Tax=Halogranum gelatinilyticum TaxID=660521 RepID=A0A1G9URE6_9EURY|nr:AbrB/MazE/SpoVT family DNA-binding domain-containing protein [Halogranum gelatinilyticum]SDM62548.1 hypothetical protein SAMN04487949_2306 [Halogranum gelatinilyticum]
MTNDEMPWSPAAFASQFQRASEEFSDQQMELFEQMLSAGGMANGAGRSTKQSVGDVDPMNAAVFKTRVQSGGRISIPDAEREALDIDEGDLVQTFVIPIKRTRGDSNE